MPTHKAYLAEPHILMSEATVVELLSGDRPVARLHRTYFHPQGGGQKGDRGFIGPVAVLDTKHAEGHEVDHFVSTLEGLVIGQTYPIKIDTGTRHLNAANHSAGHLIAALVEPSFPEIKAVQGHHWPGEARVEFEGIITEDILARVASFLQPSLDKALSEKWRVALLGDPFVNRSIQLGFTQPVPCGGTHVAHLDQIKSITIKGLKKKSDRMRVHYDVAINESAF